MLRLKQLRSFLLFTGVPTLAVLLYSLFFAQPTYETEAKLIVKTSQDNSAQSQPGVFSSIMGAYAKTSVEDAYILENYLSSDAFLDRANERLGLRAHFSHAPGDPFRRLAASAPEDAYRRFVRKKLTIRLADSGIVTIRVRAFSPKFSTALASYMIDQSEETINALNERLIASQSEIAERQLKKSMQRLLDANKQLLQFQIAHSTVDPLGKAAAQFAIVSALDTQLVQKRTELRSMSHYLQTNAYDLRRLQGEIQALEEQRAEETRTLVSSDDTNTARHLQEYEAIKLQHGFALEAYSAAAALAEKISMDAARQEKFILLVAPPQTPDEPVFPLPFQLTVTAYLLTLILYGVVRLVVATIRDHTI